MASTRDKILDAALRLFARDGFEAVSTSAIAGELGMTKGALYKHFPDKRAIFDSLVEEMLERHKAAGAGFGLAVGSTDEKARAYAAVTPERMADLGEALFRRWTQDDDAASFRHLLTIERFRDERAAAVYDELFVGGPLRNHEALFTEMVDIGALRPDDPAQMALDFWAPIHLLMQAVDCGMGIEEATTAARAHVLSFAAAHATSNDGAV